MLAKQIVDKIEDRKVAVDPTVILTIIAILGAIFELYQKCKAQPSVSSVGVLERWHLRKVIRAKIADHEMYDHIGHDIYNAILGLPQQEVDNEYQSFLRGSVSWSKAQLRDGFAGTGEVRDTESA